MRHVFRAAVATLISDPAAPPASMSLAQWLAWTLTGGVLCAIALLISNNVSPAEDAVILYEYAKNLARTGVITYGGATTPIEGATDFLWMVLIAVLKTMGVEEYFAALCLNFLAAAGIVVLCYRRSRKSVPVVMAALAALLATPFLYAAASGFSALAYSFLFVLVLSLIGVGRPARFYGACLLMCLTRPDALAWIAGPLILRMMRTSDAGRGVELRAGLLWLVGPGVAYFALRAAYFGELLPLPFLVKSGGSRDWLLFVSASVREAFLIALPLAPALLFVRRKCANVLVLTTILVPPLLFYSVLHLEQNVGNRFFAPAFFGALWLYSASLPALIVAIALTALVQSATTRTTVRDLRSSHSENVVYLARALRATDGKMLVTEAGRLAYYSGWHVHDSWGLNTPRFAKRLVAPSDLGQERYDLINAHCDIQMLAAPKEQDPLDALHRSWQNQCRVLLDYIKGSDYDVLLLPYQRGTDGRPYRPGCSRHDIHAVRRSSAVHSQLLMLLSKHGALRWEPQIRAPVLGGGDLVCR